MRNALLQDLAALGQYEIIAFHDASFDPPAEAATIIHVTAGNIKAQLAATLDSVDRVWLIAPETDGILLELSELCHDAEKKDNEPVFIGSGFDTMLTGTSKTLCYEALDAAGIHTLKVHAGEDLLQEVYFEALQPYYQQQWVAKPEDGAGCEGIYVFDSLPALRDWIARDDRYMHYLAQLYQAGIPASFSMLCRDGKAWLLSCNRQHIALHQHTFQLTGITVNGMLPYWRRFETIARKIAQMLPDALGYIGVDVIVNPATQRIDVLEINPRITTSYIGLREALNVNPAKWILECVLNDRFEMPHFGKGSLTQQAVEILL